VAHPAPAEDGLRKIKRPWDADERRFSGFNQARNIWRRASAKNCVPFNKRIFVVPNSELKTPNFLYADQQGP
jgi:hypothetical protein